MENVRKVTVFPLTDHDLLSIRADRVRRKLFLNREAPQNTRVAVRLNLNYRIRKGSESFSIQTIHNGKPTGRVIGYDHSATVRRASFFVNQDARTKIASGHTKFAMAAVIGEIAHIDASLDGIEVRFNPKTGPLFVRVDDGRAVKGAEEVTIFNTRAYARGILTYWDEPSE
jgi:hypothetical protein